MIFLLAAATAPIPPEMASAPQTSQGTTKAAAPGSFVTIDPKGRAHDYIEAFELLRKEKPTLKVGMKLQDGTFFGNVTDLSAAGSGTLLFVKILSSQGARYMIVPVEQVAEINYS